MIYRVALAKTNSKFKFCADCEIQITRQKKIAWALHDIHSQAENAQFSEDNYLLLKILHFSKRIFES